METLQNLDLLALGLAVVGIGILGQVVFLSNSRSRTNQAFLLFSIVSILWGIANYFSYQFNTEDYILLTNRLVISLAVWHAFSFFHLFYVFPNERPSFPRWYKFILFPLVVLSSIVNMTSLSFVRVSELLPAGQVSPIEKGPGMLLFVLLVIFLIVGGLAMLVDKLIKARGLERTQFKFLVAGTILSFILIFTFNFFLPALYDYVRFIPLGAVFIFPFIALAAYAIIKHHLLNVKVIATEVLTFVLAIVSFVEVVIADSPTVLIFRSVVLALILAFGVLLIKSVRREVELREKAEQLTKDLEAANMKLEELSRFKTQLLSLASHQIKSPLAAIKGFISIMLQGLYGPVEPKIQETLRKMKRSSDELINLIDSILDLRKVEEGRMEYSFEKVSLTNLVRGVIEEIQPLASDKKLKLEGQLPEKEIFVSADKNKLKQVVQNLIDNAIKYTPEGSVLVRLEEKGQRVIFSVKDSGLGISAELLPHLFEEFVRDERVKKEIRGTGFGLYIARSIVTAHGGKLWAESLGEGKGSTFFVELKEVQKI